MGPNEKVLRDAYDRYSAGEINYDLLAADIVWRSAGARLRIAGAPRVFGMTRDTRGPAA